MMKKLLLIPLVIVLLGAMVFAGCGGEEPTTPTAPTTPTTPSTPTAPAVTGPDSILFGYVVAETGHYAAFGKGGVWGARAAIDDINADGGLYISEHGRKIPIELKTVNSESDPNKAASLAEDLIVRDKVQYLVTGHIPPPMMSPVATVCQRYKTPYLHLGNPLEPAMHLRADASEDWTHIWHGGFAIGTPAEPGSYFDKPGFTVIDMCANLLTEFGPETNNQFGIFAADDSDGIAWYGAFSGFLPSMGFNVIGTDKELGLFSMDTTDFTPIIREWMANDVELIWGNSPAPPVGTMLRQMASMNYTPKMLYAGRAALFYTDVAAWGGDIPLGVGCEGWWDCSYTHVTGIGNTNAQSLCDRWIYDTGEPMNPNIGWGYAAVQMMTDAISRAGTLDQDAVNTALADMNMETMIGHAEFDADHFCRCALYWFQWVKTDNPWVWEHRIVVSQHDGIATTASPIFPLPEK